MRILVTGSAGFIARSLIKRLLQEGHFVFGLDIIETSKELFKPAPIMSFKSLIADISDSKLIDPDFGMADWWNEVDVCFHLAAMANVDEVREKREKAFQVNLHGTFNIVEACRKLKIPLLFASTACVYGHTPQHPSTEDGPTCPVDWYGVTKRAGEELIRGLLDRYVIMRFGTTFGPEMREALCTYVFLEQAIKKERFTIRGDGEQTRNWIYIEDLIDGCVSAMNHVMSCNPQGSYKETFNLTGTKSYSVRDLATVCNAIANSDFVYKKDIELLPVRPDDVYIEDISNQKARKLLGWNPQIGLYDGMKKIYDEWKNGKIQSL